MVYESVACGFLFLFFYEYVAVVAFRVFAFCTWASLSRRFLKNMKQVWHVQAISKYGSFGGAKLDLLVNFVVTTF